MSSTRWTFAVLTVATLTYCIHAASPPSSPVRATWEYKTLAGEQDERLTDKVKNDAGKEGWELVSVIYDGKLDHFYFKRPR